MATITDNLASIMASKAAIKAAIEYKTGESAGDVLSEYADEIKGIRDSICTNGYHVGEDGRWHFPEEWHTTVDGVEYDNNIELIPIDRENNESVFYYVYDCRNSDMAYISLRLYGTDLKASIGHCKNGVFYADIEDSAAVANSEFFRRWIGGLGYDYVCVRITGTQILQCNSDVWASDGVHTYAYSGVYQPMLMRYGNAPYCTNIISTCTTLESDNVTDYAKMVNNSAIVTGGLYNNCSNLQRWRQDGWGINKNGNWTTSMGNFFYNCFLLCDLPDVIDFSGWVTSKTTTIQNAFNSAYSMNSPVDVSNWDLSSVTNASNAFASCMSLPFIYGLDTWTGGAKCINWSSLFNGCYNIKNKVIDLGGITISSACTMLNNVFSNCHRVEEIYLPDMDLTNCTTVGSIFANCFSLRNISHGEIIPPNPSKLTSVASAFLYCLSLKGTDFFKGWDLTNANIGACFSTMNSLTDTRDIDLEGTTFPTKAYNYSTKTSFYYYAVNARYVDLSIIDMNIDSSTVKYLQTQMCSSLYNVIDFYPPTNLKAVSFAISSCYMISRESILRILNGLPQATSSVKLTMGAMNLSKLTDEDKAIATGKGWTLA